MDSSDIEARKAALADLLGARLGVGGTGFETRVKRAGRRLPAWARRDAQCILASAKLAAHPKLARRIDHAELDAAEARLTRYLEAVDPKERRRSARLDMAAGIAFKILLVVGLFIVVLRWQGHL